MRIHGRTARLSFACAALLLTSGSLAPLSRAQTADRPVFSGQATALQAKVLGIDVPPIGDTGFFEAESFAPPTQCLLDQGIRSSAAPPPARASRALPRPTWRR